jgi:MurNAc alpha-1-phosphate uridylyltransferase
MNARKASPKTGLPKRAMVLCAGLGQRMRPLTETTPKPLLTLGGRSLVDRILDRLVESGVEEAVVNLHYLGDQLEEQLSKRKDIKVTFSWEKEAVLETGGGIKQALPLLGEEPFFAINGDVLWLNGLRPALERLAEKWDPEVMDLLLLMHPTAYALGYEGPGDFMMDPLGRLQRRDPRQISPFVFTGVEIVKPELFEKTPEGPFSMNLIFDRVQEAERLYGLRHDGEWFHLGTPPDLKRAEAQLHHLEYYAVHR